MTSAGPSPQRIFSVVCVFQNRTVTIPNKSLTISATRPNPCFELCAVRSRKWGWFCTTFWESRAELRAGTGDTASGQKAARSLAQGCAELSLSIQSSRPERKSRMLSCHALSHMFVILGGNGNRGTGMIKVPPTQPCRHCLIHVDGAGGR